MRTTNYLQLSALVLCSIFAGCSSNDNGSTMPGVGGGTGSSMGGATSNNTSVGGSTANNTSTKATGGSGNPAGGNATGGNPAGGNATGGNPAGGNATGGNPAGGNATGGKTGTGGTSSNTPTGGAPPTTGGNTGVTTGTGGKTGTGGSSSTSVGGAATGGTTTVGGGGNCPPGAKVLSDFESGKGSLYPVPTSSTNGFWYVYKDATNCASSTQVPTAVTDAAVAATALPTSDSRYGNCNKYAMHASITNCPTYSGFGAALHPTPGSQVNVAVDISGYDGITFWMKAGSGAQGPLYLEMQSQECAAPPPNGGGTAKSQAIDMYNCHGKLFTNIPTTWTQYYVPFGTTGPRWFPTVSTSSSGKTCTASDFCEVPQLVTKNMLSIQFSLEDPFNSGATAYANYDVWIDDVAGYNFTDTPTNAGLAAPSSWSASGANAFPANKTFTGCTKPKGADGRLVADAYVNWKKNFVRTDGSNQKVISPEIDNGATVSEGIGYGMLIAAYMGDKALFDGLWGYWKANATAGTLMTWKIPGGSGSATDADEDAAFALLEASKQWSTGGYASAATTMMGDIWSHDIDGTSLLPKGGSNYGSVNPTNPSYFAPAFYKEFAKVDSGHNWAGVVSAVYTALNGSISGSNGLVSAWCTSNCTSPSTNTGGPNTDLEYQYDSHRVPWRIGIDACWNGESKAATYLSKIIGFFDNASKTTGLSSLEDIYQTSGTKDTTNGANNSMSLIGCAGVGAMSVSSASSFADRAWQFLLEGQYTANPTFTTGVAGSVKPGYTYYNATVGVLTMLTMSGNLYAM